MKRLFLALLLGHAVMAYSQNTILTGKVHDQSTGEAVPFAHIYVANTAFGTVCNADGQFYFVIPSRYQSGDIRISAVGYTTYEETLTNLITLEGMVIELTPSTTYLENIVIKADDARSIWLGAVKAHNKAFSTEKHRLQGFYRTTFQEDGYFSRLLEAAVRIHGGGGPRKRSSIEYVEIRKSEDLRQNVWALYDGYLDHLVHHHPVRAGRDFLNKSGLKRYEFKIKDILFQDEDRYYLISARGPSKGQHDAEMLIRERDQAIMRIKVLWHPENSNNYSWAWEQREDAKFFSDWQESLYEYQEFEGKMYLKRASWHRKGRVIKKTSGETVFHTESIDELLITHIEKGSFEMEFKAPMVSQNIYAMADYYPYHETFWKTYNRPPDSDYFRNAKSKLEEHLPLEEQFKRNSGNKLEQTAARP